MQTANLNSNMVKRDKNWVRKFEKSGKVEWEKWRLSQVDFQQTEHVLISLIDNWTNIIIIKFLKILSQKWSQRRGKVSEIPKKNENSLEFCMMELNENLNSFEIQ